MGDPIKDITYFGNYSEPITGKLYITNYKIYFIQNIKSEKVYFNSVSIFLFFNLQFIAEFTNNNQCSIMYCEPC